MSDELAVEVLFDAARRLALSDCEALITRLTHHLIIARQNHAHDLSTLTPRHERSIAALRAVADMLGHPPNTTDYKAQYDRRRAQDDECTLPSVSSIVREFGAWDAGLAAAGLLPPAMPSAFIRRRDHRDGRIVHRYSDSRLRDCLRACARDLGRTPMVRDYNVWREQAMTQPRTDRRIAPDIPHYRTLYERFGTWGMALAHAGLPHARPQRTETTRYSGLQGGLTPP